MLEALTDAEEISLLAGDDLFGVVGAEGTHTGTSNGVGRVGLPTIYFSDGPVGPRQGRATALPVPLALAATWDPAMARLHGQVVGNEVKHKGNDVVFAPTRFSFDELALDSDPPGAAVAAVSAEVTNVGARTGVAVPQLYLGLPSPGPGVPQPPRQLRGFRKLELAPGESARVRFAVGRRDLSYWDAGGDRWRVAPGCYRVSVGSSSRRLPLASTLAVGGSCAGASARVGLPG